MHVIEWRLAATRDDSQVTLKMSAHSKKWKVYNECHVFNTTWTAKYFGTGVKGKAMCLICGTQTAVFNEYNLNRHYTTKHEDKYRNLSDEERGRESDSLLANYKPNKDSLLNFTSYVISHKIARKVRRFTTES